MNSTSFHVYKNQKEAIEMATIDAKKDAKEIGEKCVSCVSLMNGNTLEIEASPNGEITRSKSGGWNRGGLVYMSRRVAKVYGIR